MEESTGSGAGMFEDRRPPAQPSPVPRRGHGRVFVVKLPTGQFCASWQDGVRVDECQSHQRRVILEWISSTGVEDIVADPEVRSGLGLTQLDPEHPDAS